MNLEKLIERTTMKKGDIVLVKGDGLISYSIKKMTKSKYSHCALYLEDDILIESQYGHGVHLVKLEDYKNYDVIRHRTASPAQLQWVEMWVRTQLNKDYDYMGVLGIFGSIVFNYDRNKLDDKDKYWCSELIADAFLHAELPINANKNTCLISPGDLARDTNFKRINRVRK